MSNLDVQTMCDVEIAVTKCPDDTPYDQADLAATLLFIRTPVDAARYISEVRPAFVRAAELAETTEQLAIAEGKIKTVDNLIQMIEADKKVS